MSRVYKDFPSSLLLRRGPGLAVGGRLAAEDESLELNLFSATRFTGPPLGSGPGSDSLEEFSKSVAQDRLRRTGMDDLLDAELGKHDYDWLLTPPGTPQAASLVSSKNQVPAAAAKRNVVRSASTTRASRLSVSQMENNHSVRPARSSSVTRASVSSSCLSNHNRTSVLNTSSASVTSRPSTPSKRPVTPSSGKTQVLTSRSVPTRSSTPVKARSSYGSPVVKSEPSHSSRPATPTRPRTSNNTNSINISAISSSSSRPSTPTRQPIARATLSAPTAAGLSPSVGRLPSSISRIPSSTTSSRPSSPSPRPRPLVNSASSSRPSSPSRPRAPLTSTSSRPSSPNPRPRAPVRPIDLPDFPNDVPPNLRTKLPERPLSAGRTRPGMALTIQGNLKSEPVVPSSSNRRISLPVFSRSKFPENSLKPLHSNGHYNSPENHKPVTAEAGLRRSPKPALSTENTGFGRTISKKSLDMAIKHMDIRQSLGGIRGASIFPHSIRSTVPKSRIVHSSEAIVPVCNDESFTENGSYDGAISVDSHVAGSHTIKSPDMENLTAMEQMNDLDLYGSYRYDAMLMKEDLKNTNWLLSTDDKSDQGSLFEHRFEPLPELFDPL